jgi:hypothetical protein
MADGRRGGDAQLILCLAAGMGVSATARKAGVSPKTVRRRLASPEFREKVAKARADLVARAVGRLAGSAGLAIGTLRWLAKGAASESARLASARVLLETLFKAHEQDILAQRVEQLERLLAEKFGWNDGQQPEGPDRATGQGDEQGRSDPGQAGGPSPDA